MDTHTQNKKDSVKTPLTSHQDLAVSTMIDEPQVISVVIRPKLGKTR